MQDYRGKKVLLLCWEPFCSICIRHLPIFQQLKDKNLPDVEILTISHSSLSDIKAKVKDYNFTVLHDKDLTVKKQYNLKYYPVDFYIDREGKIVEQDVGGSPDVEEYVQKLNAMK